MNGGKLNLGRLVVAFAGALTDSIVDPGNLSPELRRDLCYGCHLLPATAIDGVRRFGRGDYSFRPREPLADWLALPRFQRALDVRPNMVKVHFFRGDALAALGRLEAAADGYRRVLEIEPSHTAAYLELAQTLRAKGDRSAALRLLRHGAEVADRPEPIRQALAALASGVPPG